MANHDDKIKESNFLSNLLISAPAVGGMSYAMRELFRGGGVKFSGSSSSSFRSSFVGIDKPDIVSTRLGFLTEQSSFIRTEEGAEMARMAWQTAVKSTQPNKIRELTFMSDEVMKSPGMFYSSLQTTLESNESVGMQKTFRKFQSNLRALRSHYEKTKTIPSLVSTGQSAIPRARNMSINQLPPELQKGLQRIEKTLGVNGQISYRARSAFQKEGLGLYTFGFNVKGQNISLNVPMSREGVLIEGLSSSTRRIAPSVAVFEPGGSKFVGRMSRHEYLMDQFERTVARDIAGGKYQSQFQMQGAIDELYENTIRNLQYVPNVPSNLKDKGRRSIEKIRGQFEDVRILTDVGYRSPTESEIAKAISTTHGMSLAGQGPALVPATSPKNIAQGRLSKYDPRQWFMTPQDADLSRRPMQALREWRATPQAAQEMMRSGSVKWSIFESQTWRTDMGPYSAPHVRTLYVDPNKYASQLEQLSMEEGESLLMGTKSMRLQHQASRIADPVHLSTVRADLQDILSGKTQITPGELLGTTVEGTPFTYKANMDLLGAVPHETSSRGEYTDLFFRETRMMREQEKKFGIKAMERFVKPSRFKQGLRSLADDRQLNEGIMRIASMDELRKDPGKLNEQIITSLWDLVDSKWDEGRIKRNKKLAAFMRNPRVFASHMRNKAGSNAGFIQDMMQFTAGLNIAPEEFGRVFGSVSYAAPEAVPTGLPQPYLSAMQRNLSVGVSRAMFAGPEWTMKGIGGSVEPRLLELLESGQYGELGSEIREDLLGRIAATHPEQISTHQALSKTLRSIDKGVAPGTVKDYNLADYSAKTFQQSIEEGSVRLRLGKGRGDIFVPGVVDAPAMGMVAAEGGGMVRGNLGKVYHQFAREMSALYSDVDPLSPEAERDIRSKFLQEIHKQHAPEGKGAGSLARGKRLLGSRFLTGVSEAGGYKSPHHLVAGIPRDVMNEMFEELRISGQYSSTEINQMQQRLKSKGRIGGLLVRHPTFGQYSGIPMGFEVIDSTSPSIVLPSFNVQLDEISKNPIKISPLVGTAGDLDADAFAAFLVSPKTEKNIMKNFVYANNEYTQRYLQHTVRSQILKAKSASVGLEMDTLQNAIVSAKKLGTVQEWVPKLSTTLSEARSAVINRPIGAGSADAMALLEWLEQTPVSGKHLSAERVASGEMSALFGSIQSALEEQNSERLKGAIRSVMSTEGVAGEMLTGDVALSEESLRRLRAVPGLQGISPALGGVDIDAAVDTIMSSMSGSRASGEAQIRQSLRGRGRMTMTKLSKYLGRTSSMAGEGSQFMAKISSATTTAKNIAAAAGEQLLKHKKAVGFGFIGSLAIAAALSDPPDQIGVMAPDTGLASSGLSPGKAADRMSPENMLPPGQRLGQPMGPSRIITPSMYLSSGGESLRARAHATAHSSAHARQVGSQMQRAINGGRVHLNISDNSSTVDTHSIINRMF